MQAVLLLLLGAHLAYAGSHSFKAYYTVATGVTNYPEFTTMAVVDGVLINTYDSIGKQVVPRTEWMKNSESPDYWKRQTDIIVATEQSFKNNIQVAMGRFNQSGGVHTLQVMYGCEFDDETGETKGFNQHSYDGEDFLILDLKEMRYISPVQQGFRTQNKWNNDRGLIENQRNYFSTECIEGLKKYVQYGKSSLQRTGAMCTGEHAEKKLNKGNRFGQFGWMEVCGRDHGFHWTVIRRLAILFLEETHYFLPGHYRERIQREDLNEQTFHLRLVTPVC